MSTKALLVELGYVLLSALSVTAILGGVIGLIAKRRSDRYNRYLRSLEPHDPFIASDQERNRLDRGSRGKVAMTTP